jgi:HK97 family phage portal protein
MIFFSKKTKNNVPEKKADAQKKLMLTSPGQPTWIARDRRAYLQEGLKDNPIVAACVRLIATQIAAAPIEIWVGEREQAAHQLQKIFKRPNPETSWQDLMIGCASAMLTSGACYLSKSLLATEKNLEIWPRYPHLVARIEPKGHLDAGGYQVSGKNGQKENFKIDIKTGDCEILEIKFASDPLNFYDSISPLVNCSKQVDIYNEGAKWQKATLENSAVPSGVLTLPADFNATDEQFSRLKKEIDRRQGAKEAGKPMLLEGGMTWQQMSQTPQEIDFLNGMEAQAQAIAAAYGVPFMLLFPRETTYNNYRTAQAILWEHTVVPLLNKILKELSIWLSNITPGLELKANLDAIEALKGNRTARIEHLSKAVGSGLLTPNEARAELGYNAYMTGGDGLYLSKSLAPLELLDSQEPVEPAQ